MRAVKSNMKDGILDNNHRILHCPNCDAEYSGNSGDYFMLPEDYVFHCEDCEVEMELVNKVTVVSYKD